MTLIARSARAFIPEKKKHRKRNEGGLRDNSNMKNNTLAPYAYYLSLPYVCVHIERCLLPYKTKRFIYLDMPVKIRPVDDMTISRPMTK